MNKKKQLMIPIRKLKKDLGPGDAVPPIPTL